MKKIAKVAIKQATKRKKWYSLNVSPKELRLDVTLTNGQCFNWKKYPMLKNEVDDMKEHPHFFGVLGNRVFLLKQTKDDVFYHVLNEEKEEEDIVVKREKNIGNKNNDKSIFDTALALCVCHLYSLSDPWAGLGGDNGARYGDRTTRRMAISRRSCCW